MASIDGRNPVSSIKGIGTEDNTLFLLSDRFASLNFDGFIPRDNTFVYASDLTIGQTIFSSDPTAKDNSFFITRIDTETVTVESIEETAYSLYFLGENDLEEKYTYGAENVNGSFSQNHLFNVYKDDISDIVLGNNGWMITNQGNAIFSNVFVRGTVEATSGKIDGILRVGESKNGYPLVTLGKNIFNSTPFDGSSSEHSGLFLNKNNYLMGYDVPTNVYVTSIVATNSTEDNILRKATFTLAGHTLAVNDLVSITGFAEDKFLELDNVFPVKEITTDTFTVYYKNEIAGTTNPISVNLKAQSFALNNIYDITSLSLSQVTTVEDTSILKVYFNGNYTGLFVAGQIIDLNSILNSSLNINGQYQIISITEVVGEDNDYLTIETPRVVAGTYTTDLGQITLYDTNYKFKVGDSDNSMSYNSYTGALTVTGTINAKAGNFTNAVTVGEANLSYSVSNKQLTNNEAILTTSTVHSFVVGDSVTVSGVDATFNGTYTIKSVPTGNIFIYDKTATNVASTAVFPAGNVSKGSATEGTIFVGYGTNQITINGTGTDTTSAIFAGAGNYGNADTGFFMDASGRFSLKDKLTFSGNLLNPVLAIRGQITADTIDIGGANGITYNGTTVNIGSAVVSNLTTTSLTVGTSPNQVIISPTAVSGNPGIAITGSGDFIRNTGAFRLGGANGISYSGSGTVTVGSGVNVNGNISGASGTFTGSLSGSTITGGTIKTSATTGNGSTAGVIIDSTSARFFNNSSDTAVTTISTETGALTATSANITGTINASAGIFSGNIQTTGKIYSGTLDGSGLLTSGVQIASTGIKGIIAGATAFNLPADGVTAPTITNFEILNAKITGDGTNAYLIAGTLSNNVTVRGDRNGTDPTAAIFNTISNTPTTFAGGTGFYLNESGFFKVGSTTSNAKFDPTANSGTGQFSVTGEINATSGYIGGTTSGWNIASGHITSFAFDPYTLKPVEPITLDSGSLDGVSKIFVGTVGEWNNFSTPFYADSEGYVSIGKGLQSMTYDPDLDKILFTGVIYASGGFIGGSTEIGWRFDQTGVLVSGFNEKTVALASSGANFSGGTSRVKVTRILADDEFEEYGGLFGTIYITLDLSSLSATGKTAYIPSIGNDYTSELETKYIKFSFSDSPTSNIRTDLLNKELPIISVSNRYPFNYANVLVEYDGTGDPTNVANQITTVTSQPSATKDVYPVYAQKENATTLTLYCNEKLAGFTGYNSTYDLAVGQSVTLYTEDLAGFTTGEQSYTIASISTTPTWYAPDETYYWKIQLTVPSGSTFGITDVFTDLYFYKPTPANHVTVDVYPEDGGIDIHTSPPGSSEGYTEYTSVSTTCSGTAGLSTITVASAANIAVGMSVIANGVNPFATISSIAGTTINLSKQNIATMAAGTSVTFAQTGVAFYDNYVTVSDTGVYYMWAGDDTPAESTFNIKRNNTSGKITIKADAGTTPIGSITMWATTTPEAPTGWIFCDGRAISSTAYPELYAIVGANVPDMRGRFPLGYGGTTGPTGAAIAATTKLSGGAIRYTYTSAAGHTHNMNAFNIAAFNASTSITEGTVAVNETNHSHGVVGNTGTNSGNVNAFIGNTGSVREFAAARHLHDDGNFVTNSAGGTADTDHTHAINAFNASTSITEGAITEGTAVAQTASTATLDITPPYYSVAFIIYSGRA